MWSAIPSYFTSRGNSDTNLPENDPKIDQNDQNDQSDPKNPKNAQNSHQNNETPHNQVNYDHSSGRSQGRSQGGCKNNGKEKLAQFFDPILYPPQPQHLTSPVYSNNYQQNAHPPSPFGIFHVNFDGVNFPQNCGQNNSNNNQKNQHFENQHQHFDHNNPIHYHSNMTPNAGRSTPFHRTHNQSPMSMSSITKLAQQYLDDTQIQNNENNFEQNNYFFQHNFQNFQHFNHQYQYDSVHSAHHVNRQMYNTPSSNMNPNGFIPSVSSLTAKKSVEKKEPNETNETNNQNNGDYDSISKKSVNGNNIHRVEHNSELYNDYHHQQHPNLNQNNVQNNYQNNHHNRHNHHTFDENNPLPQQQAHNWYGSIDNYSNGTNTPHFNAMYTNIDQNNFQNNFF